EANATLYVKEGSTIDGGEGNFVGGLAGSVIDLLNYNNVKLNCDELIVKGNSKVGGLFGCVDKDYGTGLFGGDENMDLSYAMSNRNTIIISNGSSVGGFIGHINSNLNVSYVDNDGAWADPNRSQAHIYNSAAKGSGAKYVGGWIGYVDGNLNISTGGYVDITIHAAYADYVGGFIGWVNGSTTIASSDTGLSASSGPGMNTLTGTYGASTSVKIGVTDVSVEKMDIIGGSYVGALFGCINGGMTVEYSEDFSMHQYYVHIASTGGHIGGIVGSIAGDLLANQRLTSNALIYANGSYIGGLIGDIGGNATFNQDAYCNGNAADDHTVRVYNTQDNKYIGGVLGYVGGNLTLANEKNMYNGADSIQPGNITITGTGSLDYVGGVLGYIEGSFTSKGYLAMKGSIKSEVPTWSAGGIIGRCHGTLSLNEGQTDEYGLGTIMYGAEITVKDGESVGGIVGNMYDGVADYVHINKAESRAKISAQYCVGGIIGNLSVDNSVVIKDSKLTSATSIEGKSDRTDYGVQKLGGVIGQVSSSQSILLSNLTIGTTEITATAGTNMDTSYIGGLVGVSNPGSKITVDFSYNNKITITTNNKTSYVGGMFGFCEAVEGVKDGGYLEFNNNASITTPEESYFVGGLFGYVRSNVKVSHLINASSITGNKCVGGIIGAVGQGSIELTSQSSNGMYNTGNITGVSYVGGCIGYMGFLNGSHNNFPVASDFTSHADYLSATGRGTFTCSGVEIRNDGKVVGASEIGTSRDTGVGGIVGYSTGTITGKGCRNYGDVIAPNANYVGGIYGAVYSSTVTTATYTYGNVTGYAYVGGGMGATKTYTTKTNGGVYTLNHDVLIKGTGNNVGGWLGYMPDGGTFETNTDSYGTTMYMGSGSNKLSVESAGDYVGGMIGQIADSSTLVVNGSIYNYIDSVKGGSYVGGTVGYAYKMSVEQLIMQDSYTIDATGGRVGGIAGKGSLMVGDNDWTIKTLTMNLTGSSEQRYVGGFIGSSNLNEASYIISVTNKITINATKGNTISSCGGIAGFTGGFTYKWGSKTTTTCEINISGSCNQVGGYVGELSGSLSWIDGTGSQFDLGLFKLSVASATEKIGGIIGYAYPSAYVEHPTINNMNNGYSINAPNANYVGGIVGFAEESEVINCCDNATSSSKINITGKDYVGGVAGQAWRITYYEYKRYGTVTGNDYVGGICGYVSFYGLQDDCFYSYADVKGRNYVGGCFGCMNSNQSTTEANFYGNVEATGNYVGGIVGYTYSPEITVGNNLTGKTIKGASYVGGVAGIVAQLNRTSFTINAKNYNTIIATGSGSNAYVGGLIGYANYPVTSRDTQTAQNHGTVTANAGNYVGGIIGYTTSAIDSVSNGSSATVTASSSKYVGGIAGRIDAGMNYCSNSASVTGSEYVGGIVGYFAYSTYSNIGTNTGTVSGTKKVGGTIGGTSGALTMSSSKVATTLSGTKSEDIGGIIGLVNGAFTLSSSQSCSIAISGGTCVGGIVGHVKGAFTGSASATNSGNITGTGNYVGGIVGRVEGAFTASATMYNSGSISGQNYLGGMIGACTSLSDSVEHSYLKPGYTKNKVPDATSTYRYRGDICGYPIRPRYYIDVQFWKLTAGGTELTKNVDYALHESAGTGLPILSLSVTYQNCVYRVYFKYTVTYEGTVLVNNQEITTDSAYVYMKEDGYQAQDAGSYTFTLGLKDSFGNKFDSAQDTSDVVFDNSGNESTGQYTNYTMGWTINKANINIGFDSIRASCGTYTSNSVVYHDHDYT
ncbi:MAG: hypothetical protein IJW28_03060, partial [Clostridia bacterium]|nr:hypothetical protein [Clostridia bacterium]